MTQIGGDSPSTLHAGYAGLLAKNIAKDAAAPGAKFSMDAFKQSLTNPGATAKQIAEQAAKNAPLADALAQQSLMTRLAGRIPFVKDFLGPDFILNGHIGGLGKDALNGVPKATVTRIALEGGPDVAAKLAQAGVPQEVAEGIAKKGAERLAAMGGSVATNAAEKAVQTVATSAADDLAKQAVGYTMKKGFTAASEEAVKKALSSPNALEALKDLGFYAKDAKALVAKAATQTAETAAKSAATTTVEKVAETGAKQASGGIKGFFGKLLGGAKGNFIVAGVFSLVTNSIDLAKGKIGIKQFIGLTVMDTAAYGAIGMGSASLGAAIGTALFPGVGSIAGFLIGLGIGLVGGMIYDKFIRTPVKGLLGGTPAGGADKKAYDPASYENTPPNPYAQPVGGGSFAAPTPGAGLSYDEAMRQIEAMGR